MSASFVADLHLHLHQQVHLVDSLDDITFVQVLLAWFEGVRSTIESLELFDKEEKEDLHLLFVLDDQVHIMAVL